MTKSAVAQTMDTLTDDGSEVTEVKLTTGIRVDIYRCKVKNLGALLEFVSFMFEQLGVTDLDKATGTHLQEALGNPASILQLIAKSADKVHGIAIQLCSLEESEYMELDIDDMIAVIKAEWELNYSFFLNRVMPQAVTLLPAAPVESQSAPAETLN